MTEVGALASWLDTALAKVIADVTRARSLVAEAMSSLSATFGKLREQLAAERALYEATLHEVNGNAGGSGLVGALREVLARFVEDMVRISAASVRIMVEVESLRGHTSKVGARGQQIENIASTTRMLSLNARIEAQRIGTSGAVFRVVADEIKTLARESGALSKAIREALAVQSASLAKASAEVSQLTAYDLDHVVANHKHLDSTIAKLATMSASSLQILARIQGEADAALQALHLEDTVTQLLQSIAERLEAVRAACRSGDVGQLTELDIRTRAGGRAAASR
jgi:methyl-accepting chemotaxis protein